MAGELVSIFAAVGTGGALFYGTQKLFKSAEENLTVAARDRLAENLLKARTSPRLYRAAVSLGSLVEAFFGKDHWTWRCFWRSMICSVSVNLIFVAILLPYVLYILWTKGDLSWASVYSVIFGSELTIFLALAFLNILPDYLSLWKSRIMIDRIDHAVRLPSKLMYAALELALSITAAYIAILVVYIFLIAQAKYAFSHEDPSIGDYLRAVPEAMQTGGWKIVAFNLPAAAFASGWMILYSLGRITLSVGLKFDSLYSSLSKIFDLKAKPLQSIGFLIGGSLAFAYWVIAALIAITIK